MNTPHTVINQADFTATYSAEDNKLRLYVEYRLDDALISVSVKWALNGHPSRNYSWLPDGLLHVRIFVLN
jgi:hypothetical protein